MAMRPLPVLSLPTALNACRIDVGGGEVKTSPATPALSMPGPTKPANKNRVIVLILLDNAYYEKNILKSNMLQSITDRIRDILRFPKAPRLEP